MTASKSVSSVASNIRNALPNPLLSILTLPAFRRALKHHLFQSSCLLTLTVVQNLVRSNQLNVSHFVLQRQVLPSQSPGIVCRSSECVPSEHLRLVVVINLAQTTYRCMRKSCITYLLTHLQYKWFFTHDSGKSRTLVKRD